MPSKVDGFVPRTRDVNLRIVSDGHFGRVWRISYSFTVEAFGGHVPPGGESLEPEARITQHRTLEHTHTPPAPVETKKVHILNFGPLSLHQQLVTVSRTRDRCPIAFSRLKGEVRSGFHRIDDFIVRTPAGKREFIDYKTSMITDEDPLRGLLFY